MCNCCRGIHKTYGIKLVVTNAEYSPGTYHNMLGELQATFQLSDHKWGVGMCALHLSFYETIMKNVSHRIKIADTPEELGRWWLKMPGDQTKALRTSQQQWSREPTTRGRPILGGASYRHTCNPRHGMTEGHNGSEDAISPCVPPARRTAASAVLQFAQMPLTKTTHSWWYRTYLRRWPRKKFKLKYTSFRCCNMYLESFPRILRRLPIILVTSPPGRPRMECWRGPEDQALQSMTFA